jgi:replication factor A1
VRGRWTLSDGAVVAARGGLTVAEEPPKELAEVRLRDLRVSSAAVEVVARVVTLERREVTRRSDGSRRPLLSGLLSDGTATVRFTWWDPPREGIERGTVLRAAGAEVREFRGRPELTFTWKTRIGPASEVELPRLTGEELPLRIVRELAPPDEGFRLRVRVLRVQARPVTVGEERRVVFEGLVADRSGSIAFSSWSDFQLKPGEGIQIVGGYLRTFRNRTQVVLDDRSSVGRIDTTDLPDPAEFLRSPPRSIARVEDDGGGEAIAVEGTVVGLLPPSGLVYRCPTCRRSIQSGICRVHGQVDGQADLRARIVLDDGTGALTVNAGREETERLWGFTLAEVRAQLREQPDPSLLEERMLEALLGRRLRVRGQGTKDDFGITIAPESIEPVEVDLEATAGELNARLTEAR